MPYNKIMHILCLFPREPCTLKVCLNGYHWSISKSIEKPCKDKVKPRSLSTKDLPFIGVPSDLLCLAQRSKKRSNFPLRNSDSVTKHGDPYAPFTWTKPQWTTRYSQFLPFPSYDFFVSLFLYWMVMNCHHHSNICWFPNSLATLGRLM